MSNINKSNNEARTPDLEFIFAKVRELASNSAASQTMKPLKALATSKRSRDDEVATNAEAEQDAIAESLADKSMQSSAVTVTFGDCAENHVGAIVLEPKYV